MPADRDALSVRLDRIARWAVPALICLMSVHGVWAARGLFADGSYYMLNIFSTDRYFSFDPARWFAPIVTQTPVILASRAGVTDVSTLIRLQSVGLVAIPMLIWVGALAAQWRRPYYWPLVVMFAVAHLNSGFMAVGEYLLAYALVALAAALLLRADPLRWWHLVVLVVTSVLLTRSYEALSHLGLLLLAITVARLVGVRGIGRVHGTAERVTLVVLGALYAYAAAFSFWRIENPRDVNNAKNAADLMTPLTHNTQFVVSALVAIVAICVPLTRRGATRRALVVVGVGAAALILAPGVWAAPADHYLARTVAGIALFGVLAGAILVEVITAYRAPTTAPADAPTHRVTIAWVVPFALLCAQVVPFTVHTAGFAAWTADFERVVTSRTGDVPIADAGLDPHATTFYGWAWTNSILSLDLQGDAGQATILMTPGNAARNSSWMPNPLPQRLPKFTKDSPLFG